MNNNVKKIKNYHDILYSASISDKEKMTLTSLIALLVSNQYVHFDTDYRDILLNLKESRAFNQDFALWEYIQNEDDLSALNPTEIIVELAKEYLETIRDQLNPAFVNKIITLWNSLKTISSLNAKQENETEPNIVRIVESFVNDCYPYMQVNNTNSRADVGDFLGQMFAEINGRGANGKTGIVLTPYFIADFMTDLLNLNYKEDVLFDGACGSGSFLVAAYTKMRIQLEDDYEQNKLTYEEYQQYKNRLDKEMFYGNDIDESMVLLCLMNFSILGMDIKNVTNEDFFNLDLNYYKDRDINKAILNPPFEYNPAYFIKQKIERIKNVQTDKDKLLAVICPPQSLSKYADKYLVNILNNATLKYVIQMQDNAFKESGDTVATSVFLFDLSKAHNKTDKVLYYDFTDTGYEYFKDSGLIDKTNSFESKKEKALKTLSNEINFVHDDHRSFSNFYDIPDYTYFEVNIDPVKIANNDRDELDLTAENQMIRILLKEREEVLKKENNDKEFTDYLIKKLSK